LATQGRGSGLTRWVEVAGGGRGNDYGGGVWRRRVLSNRSEQK